METFETLIEFVKGNSAIPATFDSALTLVWVLVVVLAVVAGVFAFVSRRSHVPATGTGKGSAGSLSNRRNISVIAIVLAVLIVLASLIFAGNAFGDTQERKVNAGVSEKVTATVDDSGNVTIAQGTIKNSDTILGIGIRKVSTTSSVDLSDATLKVKLGDETICSVKIGAATTSRDYVTTPKNSSAKLTYEISISADKAKALIGKAPITINTTVDVVSAPTGKVTDKNGAAVPNAKIVVTYTDPYTQQERTFTTTSDKNGSYTLEPMMYGTTGVIEITDSDGHIVKKSFTADEKEAVAEAVVGVKTEVPAAVTGLVYTGTEQTGVAETAGVTLTGNKATDAGSYTAKATLKAGYVWTDGTSGEKSISWSIEKATPEITSLACADVPYGTAPSPSAQTTFGTITYTYSDTETGTYVPWSTENNAGTYYVKATVAEADNWNAAESEPVSFSVTKIKVDVPAANTGLVYTGSEQAGIELPNEAKYSLTGNTATNAGNYMATASLTDKINYEWNLATPTSDDQTINWSIAQAKNTMTFDMEKTSAETTESDADKKVSINAAQNVPEDAATYKVYIQGQTLPTDLFAVEATTDGVNLVCRANTPANTYDLVVTATSGGKNYKELTLPETPKTTTAKNFTWTVKKNAEFYAVLNTAAEGEKVENTLSFYYDTNKEEHKKVTTRTVFDNLPTEATQATDWGYHKANPDNENKPYSVSVKNVVIDASVADYHGLRSTAYMFCGYDSDSEIYYLANTDDISGCEYLDVSNVENMSNMFSQYAYNSTFIAAVPNVSNWNTSKVQNMSAMFWDYAYNSTTITAVPNVSNWNTSKVQNMSGMFRDYAYSSQSFNAVPNVSNWNTSKVLDMQNMFAYYARSSQSITAVPDVSNWDTSAVLNVSFMFCSYAKNNTSITAVPNVSKWNTSKVDTMSQMFYLYACSSQSITAVPDVSNWNTSAVTSMSGMFQQYAYSSTSITAVPDVSNWDTSAVQNMSYMFKQYAKSSSNTLNALDLRKWNIGALKNVDNMFEQYNIGGVLGGTKAVVYGTDWSDKSVDSATNMFEDSNLKGTTSGGWSSANTSDTGCFTALVPVTGVSLNKTSTSISVGSKETLTATIEPDNATNKNITWSSSDETVATVSATGEVTGVSAGEATITVKTEDGGFTATCTVTVTKAVE